MMGLLMFDVPGSKFEVGIEAEQVEPLNFKS
jgi:hypothetical protein